MKKAISLFIIILAAAGYVLIMQDYTKNPDVIYYNGTIITMEESRPAAEALYVSKGIIMAVGSNEEILKLKKESTFIFDLKGKTMVPGFIDPHTHVAISTFLYPMVDLSGFSHKTNKEVWEHLKKETAKFKEGEWIVCKGLDPILTKDLKTPHISFLDRIAPDNPLLILSQSLHSYWANTRGFKEAGIDNTSPNPSASSFYEKDSNGNLTGFIAEQEAFAPFRNALLKVTPKKKLAQSTEYILREYARRGNTTVVSAGITTKDKNALRLYEHLSGEKPSLVNQILVVAGLFPKRRPLPRHFLYIRYDAPHLLPEIPEGKNYFFNLIGIKHWYDGSPYTGSMYLNEPYMDSELARKEFHIPRGHRGKSLISKQVLTEFIKKYSERKWQIAIHAQGDRAIAEILDAFEEVNKTLPLESFRHRLEHCLFLDEKMIVRMKKLGITPSMHVNHIYYYGKALKNSIIGEERAARILPVHSIAAKKMKFSLHADQPMFDSNPLHLIHTAVNRRTREGEPMGLSEAISVSDALKAMTIYGAWQIGYEEALGSIKKGKYADLVILDKNPLKVPEREIMKIKVLKTIVNGNVVFD